MIKYDWHNVRARLRAASEFIPQFAAHPVRGMRTLPDWDWPTIVILQAGFAAATASLAALIARNWVLVATSLVVAPITYLVLNALASALFYAVFRFAFEREVPYRQVFLASTFASLPGQAQQMLASLFPPMMVIGAAVYGALFYVASVDVFRVPPARARGLLVFLFLVYTGLTAQSYLRLKSHRVRIKERASPESMDILERELNPEDAN